MNAAGVILQKVWATQGWWMRRVVMLPVTLFFFCILVFFVSKAIPGDPLAQQASLMTKEQAAKLRDSYGLDDGLFVQLGDFLKRMATFNLGSGITDGAPIAGQLAQRLPTSLQLAVLGLFFTLVISVALALCAGLWPRTVASRVIRIIGGSAGAFPDFVIGVLGILVFFAVLRIAPAPLGLISPLLSLPPTITGLPLLDALLSGQFDVFLSMAAHLWLPLLVLACTYAPAVLKVLVIAVDGALSSPQIRFKVSVGIRPMRVIPSVLRQAMPVTITTMANLSVVVLGGTIVIEQLFGLGGLGQYAVQGVVAADYSIVQGFLVVYALICMVIFLICDVAVSLVDPRRQVGQLTS